MNNRPDLMIVDDVVDAKADEDMAKQFAAERIRRMDLTRLQELQIRAQAHLAKTHRRTMRDAMKDIGPRQFKKLQKQARRDAKALQSTTA